MNSKSDTEESVFFNINKPLSIGGFTFIFLSCVGFAALFYLTIYVGPAAPPESFKDSAAIVFVHAYLPHITVFVTAIVSAALGVRLLKAAGSAYIRVIPPDDYPVLAESIREGKAESIDQYVRLSSLSGFTGGFTKMGLTGLPLTTVSLTLIFSVLAIFDKTSFLDLAKLTLGAFIGSFVQKQVERGGGNTPGSGAGRKGKSFSPPRPPLPT